jgi:ParB/RepB/Spo0J family partition protein
MEYLVVFHKKMIIIFIIFIIATKIMNIQEINIEDLSISVINVRKTSINEINELADSIAENGLINPITVRLIVDDKYDIIAGQRRYLAMKQLNKYTITCNIVIANETQAEEISLIENIQKKTLSNCDKVRAYSKLYNNYSNDYSKIKNIVKISKATINKYLKIKDLPIEILEKLDATDKSKITIDIAIHITAIMDNNINIMDIIDRITPLKTKNKMEVIKKIKENNLATIEEVEDIIENINEDTTDKQYKGPFVFDSIKQQNLLIPDNMYVDIINLIKERHGEDIVYF